MKYFKHYSKIVAIVECAAGNEETGVSWFETKTFDRETPISEIIEWSRAGNGKLIITIDESSVDFEKENDLPF